MKLFIDDVREAPIGYHRIKSVNEAIKCIENLRIAFIPIEVIDIDHDAGDYAYDGVGYIRLLDWLEFKGYNYPIHIHSMNPVGIENMRRIIQKNGWKEV